MRTRSKFKELEEVFNKAYDNNYSGQMTEEGEIRFKRELKTWTLKDLKDELNYYKNPYKPSYGFMEYIKYYIKEEEEQKKNKEEDYITYLFNQKDNLY